MTSSPIIFSLQSTRNNRQRDRIVRRQKQELARLGPIPQITTCCRGRVVISAVSASALRGRGKVEPDLFFPAFLNTLAQAGWQPEFFFDEEALADHIAAYHEPVALINLYNEERVSPPNTECMHKAEMAADFVFNSVKISNVIGHKPTTNRVYHEFNIPVPETTFDGADRVFTNLPQSTSRAAWISDGQKVDSARYNTRFIETARLFSGQLYRNMVRILACGPHIVHGFVGIRSVTDNPQSASVHGVDTPLDAPLVSYFFNTLFEDRRVELEILTQQINAVIGPGFYHHDLLIDAQTEQIYVCETGIKFDAFAYHARMRSIVADTPCLHLLEPNHFAATSSLKVLQVIDPLRPPGREPL